MNLVRCHSNVPNMRHLFSETVHLATTNRYGEKSHPGIRSSTGSRIKVSLHLKPLWQTGQAAMPVVSPENVVDEPEGGWPWQLEHVWVLEVVPSQSTRPSASSAGGVPLGRKTPTVPVSTSAA